MGKIKGNKEEGKRVMAQKTGIYGVMVEDWLGSLPVIVKDKKSGKINKEETYRLNKNNKLFRDASERNSFTLGKLANFLYEITSSILSNAPSKYILPFVKLNLDQLFYLLR